ncbi:MAG: lipid-A-disaccharide synthase-related protein [Cyanobacteria bacterium J06581_3]
MNLLCISNGHGEDAIAMRILSALRQQSADIQIAALPISGTGQPYRSDANIDIIGPTQTLPSGGFLNRDPKQLARDMQGGLISLTRAQLRAIKAWTQKSSQQFATIVKQNARQGNNTPESQPLKPQILAVGDIVPLIFSHRTGLAYHFIGTAKSEYWLQNEQTNPSNKKLWDRVEGWSGSVYLPWERWLMNRPQCRSLFVRDALTAERLQTLGIKAQYEGNPMMDGLTPTGKLDKLFTELNQSQPSYQNALVITLIPGSRPPEAYTNWATILKTIPSLIAAFPDRPLILLGAIAPNLIINDLPFPLTPDTPEPWTRLTLRSSYQAYTRSNITLIPTQNAYTDCLHKADIAIATAGTATEQLVGLGKPAITLPGPGPQFTYPFALVQAKMLGPSVQIVENPENVGSAIAQTMNDPDRLRAIATNGKQRMGESGAAQRIANQLLKSAQPA